MPPKSQSKTRKSDKESIGRIKEKFIEYLEERGIPEMEIVDYFGYGVLGDFFNIGRWPSGELYTLEFVQRMVLATGIDPKTFEILSENLDRIKKKEKGEDGPRPNQKYYYAGRPTFTKWGANTILRTSLNLDGFLTSDNRDGLNFADKYYKAIAPYLTPDVKSISTVEFLEKGLLEKPWSHLNFYNRAHTMIFKRIEDIYETGSGFQYHRYIAHKKEENEEEEETKTEDQIIEALINTSIATISHIYACMYKFNEQDLLIGLAPVDRNLNYGIIEYKNSGRKVLVTETYRHNGEALLPDTLFVYESPEQETTITAIVALYSESIQQVKKRCDEIPETTIKRKQLGSLLSAMDKHVQKLIEGEDDPDKRKAYQEYWSKKCKNINIIQKKFDK